MNPPITSQALRTKRALAIMPMDTDERVKNSRLPAAPPYTTILLFPKDDNPAANANGTVKPSTLEMY